MIACRETMIAKEKMDWASPTCRASGMGGAVHETGVRLIRFALSLAILVIGTSCAGDGPPERSIPSGQAPDALPAAVVGMAGPTR